MANIRDSLGSSNATPNITSMGYRTEEGTLYTGNITAGSGYYTYNIWVPEDTLLAPRVRSGTVWQGACAPTYLLASGRTEMDIQCSDCCSPPSPSGNAHTIHGNVHELPINGTKLQLRDKGCECDDECEDDYWFKTATIWADDYEFDVLLPGNSTYSVYHWRRVSGVTQWVACASPTTVTLEGQTGMLCLSVRATSGPSDCD